jgi:hypothetical protein
MIEVESQPGSNQRRIVLINLVWNQVVHHHASKKRTEKPRAVSPTRPHQRLADPDVPVRVVRIAMREPRLGEEWVNMLVERRRIEVVAVEFAHFGGQRRPGHRQQLRLAELLGNDRFRLRCRPRCWRFGLRPDGGGS